MTLNNLEQLVGILAAERAAMDPAVLSELLPLATTPEQQAALLELITRARQVPPPQNQQP